MCMFVVLVCLLVAIKTTIFFYFGKELKVGSSQKRCVTKVVYQIFSIYSLCPNDVEACEALQNLWQHLYTYF